MRQIVVCESPVSPAIDRSDQWVASAGLVASVRSITSATLLSSMVRGRPGRGSSDSPSMRSVRKRRRHLPTVCALTPISAATALLLSPSAQRRIMRQRSDIERATRWRRTCASRNDRSPALRPSAAIGRPIPRGIEITSNLIVGGETYNETLFSAR